MEKLNGKLDFQEERLANKAERWDVQIQTGFKTKTRGCQTTELPSGGL